MKSRVKKMRSGITGFLRDKKKVYWLSVMVVVLFSVFWGFRLIGRTPLGFDEGIILQSSVNMSQHGKYASFGALFDGKDKVFDPYLSTGPTVTVPIAIMFKFFGIGAIQARLVILTYHTLMLILIAYIAYKVSNSWFAICAPLLLFLLTSSPINFRLDILGEIPAITFALASFIAWKRENYVWAGIFAGMAALSKTLMLVLFAGGSLSLSYAFLSHPKKRRKLWLEARQWVLGAMAPLVAWELVRFWQLGFSPRAYKHSIREFINFFKANGSGVSDSGTAGLSLRVKANMIVSDFALTRLEWFIIVVALGAIIVMARKRYKDLKLEKYTYGLSFIAIYLFWWFGLSNGGYTRYTIPVAAIGSTLIMVMVLDLRSKVSKPHTLLKWAPVGLLLPILVCIKINYAPLKPPTYDTSLKQQVEIARQVKSIAPHGVIHVGWWQNPEIMTLADVHSKELSQMNKGENGYLLLSPAAADIAPQTYASGLKLCGTNVVLSQERYVLCKITKQ